MVKNRAKEFYKKLLQDSGEIGEYLIGVVEKAIAKTEFTYAEWTVDSGSCVDVISYGLEDVPPYLRIIKPGSSGVVYLDPEHSEELNEAEKASYYEKLAREQQPEYDNGYDAICWFETH